MKLRYCFIGKIIQRKHEPYEVLNESEYGWISGISTNDGGECILKVIWADGLTSTIHPSNIEEV